MEISLQIIFWTSVLLLLHSYVFYPFSLKLLSKSINNTFFFSEDDLPYVNIIMAVHNEEKIIKEKIESVFQTDYPIEKFNFFIGSDNSNDSTNDILETMTKRYQNLYYKRFTKRTGKPEIINQLVKESSGEVLIITDANVIFQKNTIYELIKYFKDEEIGLTDSLTYNPVESINKEGISVQENRYLIRETKIKRNEGLIWGTMMGPFGGCYAIRRSLYKEVPSNFLVDDFYINMNVLLSDKKTIINSNAVVFENVSNDINIEFKRKVRISAGNFQNFNRYFKVLFSKRRGLSYCFFSHKVIRWFGPFIMLLIILSNLMLSAMLFYQIVFIIFIFSLIIPLIDYLFKIFKINLRFLRFISHFYVMNLALFVGFFKYLSGIKSGIWQPTSRK